MLAGRGGLQEADAPEGAVIYARLLTRIREEGKALKVLDDARAAADRSPNSPGLVLEQAEKQGLASVSDSEWRKRRVALRQQTAEQRYRSAILEIGKTVKTYFTPEEKARFAQLIDDRWNATRRSTMSDHLQWIDVASAAGMVEEEARMRKDELLAPSFPEDTPAGSRMQGYVRLQRSRMEYRELAQTLETFAGKVKANKRQQVRMEEAHAYRDAGDETAELQTLSKIGFHNNGDVADRARYFDLLLKHDVPTFESFARDSNDMEYALAAPNYAVQHSDVKIARAALSSHSKPFNGQWKNAYDSLIGLYFRDQTQITESSFYHLLGEDRTIGQRVESHPGATATKESVGEAADAPLAGDLWFYYGMRYGVYRTMAPKQEWAKHDPEDFLAAGLENHATVTSHLTLAREYAYSGDTARALDEYRHALELAPESSSIHDAMALLWKSNKKEEAIAEWRLALVTLNRIVNKGPAPESFWIGFEQIARHLESRKLGSQLHGEMDTALRTYIKINGDYRSEELLKAAFETSPEPAAGTAWVISLSEAATAPLDVLEQLNGSHWIPAASREPLLLRGLDLARLASSKPETNNYGASRVTQAQTRLVLYYVAQKEDAKATALLKELTDAQRRDGELFEAEIELAARGHRIGDLLHGADSDASNSDASNLEGADDQMNPSMRLQMLRSGAARLMAEGFKAEAVEVWEYVFGQLQSTHGLMASDYMGLAEARLKTGDVRGAVSVLKRMTLMGNDLDPAGIGQSRTIENFDNAAALLVENGRDEEAIEFLAVIVKGEPWEDAFALRLAQAELRASKNQPAAVAALEVLAGDNQASYGLRSQATLSLQGKGTAAPKYGSEELQLLARGRITSDEARKPYFVAARITAADELPGRATSERLVLLHEAMATQPAGLDEIKNATPIHRTGNDLTLKIFIDEATSGHSATALVAVEPLLNETNRFTAGVVDAGTVGSDSVDSAGEEAADGDTPERGEDEELRTSVDNREIKLTELERLAPLPPMYPSSESDKLKLAVLVARVYEDSNQLASALPYLKLGRYVQKDQAQRIEMDRHIQKIEMTLWLERQNALRQPLIQKGLAQSGVVRPRLTVQDAANMEAQ